MDEQLKSFQEKGYVILKGLLSAPEVRRVKEAMEKAERIVRENQHFREDSEGGKLRACQWKDLPNNVFAAVAKSEKVVGVAEKCLGGEIYHYHSKFILKDAHTGGAFVWHQDYGFWHEYRLLYPTLGTLWIAVDKADKTNGCLQIIEGSHLVGRINMSRMGDQAGSDPERVELLKKRLPVKYVELEPGDAMFFHSNLLHTSAKNSSDKRRWAFLVCYNRADNLPYGDHPHADYKRLEKVSDSEIMTCPLTAGAEKWNFGDSAAVKHYTSKLLFKY